MVARLPSTYARQPGQAVWLMTTKPSRCMLATPFFTVPGPFSCSAGAPGSESQARCEKSVSTSISSSSCFGVRPTRTNFGTNARGSQCSFSIRRV